MGILKLQKISPGEKKTSLHAPLVVFVGTLHTKHRGCGIVKYDRHTTLTTFLHVWVRLLYITRDNDDAIVDSRSAEPDTGNNCAFAEFQKKKKCACARVSRPLDVSRKTRGTDLPRLIRCTVFDRTSSLRGDTYDDGGGG